jgi:hypothetical protein
MRHVVFMGKIRIALEFLGRKLEGRLEDLGTDCE